MVLRDDLIAKVRHLFGLNLYEAKIWLALLARGSATAGELSDLADVPRSRTYDILESLEKKGFVIAKVGKPLKYIAVSPQEILERMKRRYKEEIEKKIELLESLKNSELLQELEELHKSSSKTIDVFEKSGYLRGRHNLFSHIETMFRSAEKNIYILTTETEFIRKMEAFKNLFLDLKERGVRVVIITPIVIENAKYIEDMGNVIEIYDAGDLRGRVITVDSEEVMFMIVDDKEVHSTNDIGMWVYSPFLARAIESLIEKVIPSLKPAKEKLKELNL